MQGGADQVWPIAVGPLLAGDLEKRTFPVHRITMIVSDRYRTPEQSHQAVESYHKAIVPCGKSEESPGDSGPDDGYSPPDMEAPYPTDHQNRTAG